ncbi:MAG: oligosaccharide flippase family protein [Armatimonadota bacterium]|nr:oligosaccharide flippase family protein [Armatimonadota bacterium]
MVFSLAGQVAPGATAVVVLPLLARGFGDERLGVLAIIWAAVGYFSLLDAGLGRALTHVVASRGHGGGEDGLPAIVRAAWVGLGGLGLLAGAAIAWAAPWLATVLLNLPEGLIGEVERTLCLVGAIVPLLTLAVGARAVLEARHRFDLVNAVRVPLGVATYAGPALVLPFTTSLVAAVAVLVAARLAALLAFLWLAVREIPQVLAPGGRSGAVLGEFVRASAWMTLANVAGSVLVYVDRVVVGALVPVAALAHYAAPVELLTRFAVVPAALGAVIFPSFSVAHRGHPTLLAGLFARGVGYVFLGLFPPALLAATFAPELLATWFGPRYVEPGTPVVRWCAAGLLINGLALVPFALLQAGGRARLTAIVQAVEVPLYVVTLVWLTRRDGIVGAAVAGTLRIGVDALLLFGASSRLLPNRQGVGLAAGLGLAGVACVGVATIPAGVPARIGFAAGMLVAVAGLATRVFRPRAWTSLSWVWRWYRT